MLNIKANLDGHISDYVRRPQRRTSSPNSPSADVTAISYGFIIRCTTVTPELWCRRHQKSKPLVASIAIL